MPHARIDVHHHFLPPFYKEALKKHGKDYAAGVPLPEWSPELSLGVMDANGIEKAIVSIGSPGVHFGDDTEASNLAVACNEYGRDLKRAHPGRFGYFAQLPMPMVSTSVSEAKHALDHMNADGVGLLASTNGTYLGDPAFEPLMKVLDERAVTVFVHPDIHPSTEHLNLKIPGFFIEFLVDTSRAVMNLALSGTFERYPNIRWIFAHAGGFVPYIAWRLSLADRMPEPSKGIPQGMLTYLKRLHFDTALSPSRYSMASLLELAGASHILFATDFPYAPAVLAPFQISELERVPFLTDENRGLIYRENALPLFPSLFKA